MPRVKVKVLWATPRISYDTKAVDWDVGVCPSYYCEMIEAAGGEVLNMRPGLRALADMSTPSLFAPGAAGDVDVLLTATVSAPLRRRGHAPAVPWPDARCVPLYDAIPDSVPAKARRQMWTFGKTRSAGGQPDWFSARLGQPDAVVEELADVFYPSLQLKAGRSRRWWANGFSEFFCDPGVAAYTSRENASALCANADAPFVPERRTRCAPEGPLSARTSGSTELRLSVVGTLPGLAVAVCWVLVAGSSR